MLKPIAVALAALSLTACITFEVPAPEYPEPPEVGDSVGESDDAQSAKVSSERAVSSAERSTPRPADTARPAVAVNPAKQRPDTSRIVLISEDGLDSGDLMDVFESNIHMAEKAFGDKWIWFAGERVERVERNRLLLYTGSSERRLYARFPPGAGLEDVGEDVRLLCFGPFLTEREDTMILTVSDCEIISNPLDPDGKND